MLATRRHVLAIACALPALAACQNKGGGPTGESAGDMALGDPKAPVQLIEYASVTCPHCREFHDRAWTKLKANYIDTGKVRFIFREFPTAPEELAVAGFQVARCANRTPQQYFTLLDVMFEQQIPLYEAYNAGNVKDKLLAIAKSAGVSEDQFNACIADPGGIKRIQETEKGAAKFDVTGTPTLILNGQKLEPKFTDYDQLSKLIDSKLKGA